MLTSKLTRKGQVTVPKRVRDALGAGPDDTLVWHAALSSTLADEWESPEDQEAFRDL